VHWTDIAERFPAFPRTAHLPFCPQAQRDDLIAKEAEAQVIFAQPVCVEEKLDGANAGIVFLGDELFIRNRDHILRKGFDAKTPAKKQFAALWTWAYDHADHFEQLAVRSGRTLSVYGEWLYAKHTIHYDRLSALFIPFDLYDPDTRSFLDPRISRQLLADSGFEIPPLLHEGPVPSYEFLAEYLQRASAFADTLREGVYLKVGDGSQVTHRFKMVRTGFGQPPDWNRQKLIRNQRGRCDHLHGQNRL
jgi:atypical dual specificity phosphatase